MVSRCGHHGFGSRAASDDSCSPEFVVKAQCCEGAGASPSPVPVPEPKAIHCGMYPCSQREIDMLPVTRNSCVSPAHEIEKDGALMIDDGQLHFISYFHQGFIHAVS